MKSITPIILSLSLFGCIRPQMIPPSSWDVRNPAQFGCSCTKIPEAELTHMILVGDALMAEWTRTVNECNPYPVPVPQSSVFIKSVPGSQWSTMYR